MIRAVNHLSYLFKNKKSSQFILCSQNLAIVLLLWQSGNVVVAQWWFSDDTFYQLAKSAPFIPGGGDNAEETKH